MNEPIRVGLAGFGASAKTFHLPFLRARPQDFEVTAVLERKAVEAPVLLPQARVHRDLDSFLADRSWDLGIITLPNDLHAPTAIAILKSGRAVVVEKPLCITAAEGQTIVDAAKEAQRPAFAFQSRRLDGDFLLVKSLLDARTLGRLVRMEVRYDRWSNVLRKKAWKENGSTGNTLLEDLGSHLLDQAVTLFGMPKALTCRLGIQRDLSTTVDAFRISLDYDGLWVDLESGMVARAPLFHWSLQGTEGAFVKQGMDPQEAQLQRGLSPLDSEFGREDSENSGWLYASSGETTRVATPPGRYIDFYSDVRAVLRDGAVSAFPAEHGLRAVRLLEMCRQSAQLGRTIEVS